jgi:hypothetical protein
MMIGDRSLRLLAPKAPKAGLRSRPCRSGKCRRCIQARELQPGHRSGVCNAAADEVDAADDFMARNDRIFDAGKLRIDDMKVGPANATRADFYANFSVAGAGIRTF